MHADNLTFSLNFEHQQNNNKKIIRMRSNFWTFRFNKNNKKYENETIIKIKRRMKETLIFWCPFILIGIKFGHICTKTMKCNLCSKCIKYLKIGIFSLHLIYIICFLCFFFCSFFSSY